MLQFTKEVDYGLQFIIKLSENMQNLVSLREFSEESKISFLFMQRIVKKLREANLIESTKGSKGGYKLTKTPNKISLRKIVEAIEGEYAVVNCLKKNCHCSRESKCKSKEIFQGINLYLIKYLDSISLDEAICKK